MPPPTPTLEPEAIHLWHIALQANEEVLQTCAALLSPDETARAHRFRGPTLSNRYIAAHGATRTILASYLAVPPATLNFTHGAHGKPFLQNGPLSFNLSHSKERAVLAVTQHAQIGVDIEFIEPERDLSNIAATHFSPAEASAVNSLQGEARTLAFYKCWTAKEAYLKATGTGLATTLDSFDFVFPPTAPTRLTRIGSSPGEHLRWQTFAFTQDAFAIAILVEGQNHTLHHKTWQP